MVAKKLRIRIQGDLNRRTAEVLGVEVEVVGDRFELVIRYIDQAQLTGLLLQLSDLHIAFDRIEIRDG